VGDKYAVASDGRTLVSADKLRQYRPPTYKPNLGKVQANLEWRVQPSGRPATPVPAPTTMRSTARQPATQVAQGLEGEFVGQTVAVAEQKLRAQLAAGHLNAAGAELNRAGLIRNWYLAGTHQPLELLPPL
jgi:hypothetical protein